MIDFLKALDRETQSMAILCLFGSFVAVMTALYGVACVVGDCIKAFVSAADERIARRFREFPCSEDVEKK